MGAVYDSGYSVSGSWKGYMKYDAVFYVLSVD